MNKNLKPILRPSMARAIIALLLVCTGPGRLQAQTASFNFTAAPTSIAGWTNLSGDPSTGVHVATDATTGITISSIAPSNWIPLSDVGSAYDGVGAPNGVFFPAGVMNNHWFQFTGAANYNAATPQLQISGLNPNTIYAIRMTGSSVSGYNTNPSRYTVAGKINYGYIDNNSEGNTVSGAIFNNISPDNNGFISIYVNTLPGTDGADICGLQITPAASYWSATGNASINPASNFLGTTDNKALSLRTNNVERMSVQPNGNVLVGKSTDDGGALQVGGVINIDAPSASVPINIETNHIYSTFLEYSNTNTAAGASVGERFYNSNGLVAQLIAGGPSYPFIPNGFAFHDISGGGFDFVSANPTGFISWGNNFKNFGGSKMIFYPTPGNLLIGSTVDNGSKLQVNGNTSITGNLNQTAGIASFGNGFYFDHYVDGSARFFSGGKITYQSNGTDYQHVFHNDIGSAFTGTLVTMDPGFYTLQDNQLSLNVLGAQGARGLCVNMLGNVGIGTITPQSRLAVNGTVTAQKVKVTQTGWPDYVFGNNYRLLSLPELEKYINAHQHLPEIPSAAKVRDSGLDLGETQAALLKKVEELTLYMIELNKKVDRLTRENETLKKGRPHINSYKTK